MNQTTRGRVRLAFSFMLVIVTAIVLAKYMPPIGAGGLDCATAEACRQIQQRQREMLPEAILLSVVSAIALSAGTALWPSQSEHE